MFHVLWAFVLITLAGSSLWLWRRPQPLRMPRAFWLINLCLAGVVCLFTFFGLQTVFGSVHPYLEVAAIQADAPAGGWLTLGSGPPADLVLHNPFADRLHAGISRTGVDSALLLPLSADRRIEVNGIDAGALELTPGTVLALGGQQATVTGIGWRSVTLSGPSGEVTVRGSIIASLLSLMPGVHQKYELSLADLDESGGFNPRRPSDPALPGVHERLFLRAGRVYLGFATPRDRSQSALRVRLPGSGGAGASVPERENAGLKSGAEAGANGSSGFRRVRDLPTALRDGDELTIGYTRYRVGLEPGRLELRAVANLPRLALPLEDRVLAVGAPLAEPSARQLVLPGPLEPAAVLWLLADPGRRAQVSPLGPGYWLKEVPGDGTQPPYLRSFATTGPGAPAGGSGDNVEMSGANVGTSGANVGTSGANAGTSGANAGTSGANAGTSSGNVGTSSGNIGTSSDNLGPPSEKGGAPSEKGGAPSEKGGAPSEKGGAPSEKGGAPSPDLGTLGAPSSNDGAASPGGDALSSKARAGGGNIDSSSTNGGGSGSDPGSSATSAAARAPGVELESDSPPLPGTRSWAPGEVLELNGPRSRIELRYQAAFLPSNGGLRPGAPFARWWTLLALSGVLYLMVTVLASALGLLSPDNFLVFHLTGLLVGLGSVLLAQLGVHSDAFRGSFRFEAYGPRQLQALCAGLFVIVASTVWLSRGRLLVRRNPGRRSVAAGIHPFDRLDTALWPSCPYPGGLVGGLARQPRVWSLYFAALALLIVQLPFGETGIAVPGLGSIQPIEAVKTLLLVYFAYWTVRVLETKAARLERPERLADRVSYLLHALPVLLILALSYGLDDISPILIFSVFLYLIYRLTLVRPALGLERGVRIIDAVWLETVLLLVVLPVVVYQLVLPHRASVYRRFLVWIDPWENTGEASQVVSSLWSMLGVGGGGGLFGGGLGQANGPLLPAVQDDFILSFLGNRLGMVGIGLLMATYLLYLLGGVRAVRSVSLETRPDLGSSDRIDRVRMLMIGGLLLFIIQLAVVFGSVTGALPVVGQPLPFISSGGSHLVLFCLPVTTFLVLGARWVPQGEREKKSGEKRRRPWA